MNSHPFFDPEGIEGLGTVPYSSWSALVPRKKWLTTLTHHPTNSDQHVHTPYTTQHTLTHATFNTQHTLTHAVQHTAYEILHVTFPNHFF